MKPKGTGEPEARFIQLRKTQWKKLFSMPTDTEELKKENSEASGLPE